VTLAIELFDTKISKIPTFKRPNLTTFHQLFNVQTSLHSNIFPKTNWRFAFFMFYLQKITA